MIQYFSQTVSYNQFVELIQYALMPITMFAKTCCLGTCTGIFFVDSTPIRVCKNISHLDAAHHKDKVEIFLQIMLSRQVLSLTQHFSSSD